MDEPHIFIGYSPLHDRDILAAEGETGDQLFRVMEGDEITVRGADRSIPCRIDSIDDEGLHVTYLAEGPNDPPGVSASRTPSSLDAGEEVRVVDKFERKLRFLVDRSSGDGAVLSPASTSVEMPGRDREAADPAPISRPAPAADEGPDAGEEVELEGTTSSGRRDRDGTQIYDAARNAARAAHREARGEAAGSAADRPNGDAVSTDASSGGTDLAPEDPGVDRPSAASDRSGPPTAGGAGSPEEEGIEADDSPDRATVADSEGEYLRLLDLIADHGLRPMRAPGQEEWQCFPFSVPIGSLERLLERGHAIIKEDDGTDYLEITSSGRDFLQAHRQGG